jgi:2-phospho-L-lactate guanylyltransferase
LVAAEAHAPSLLADAAGTGTTLLTARSGIPLQPEFGRRSGAAHLRSGAVALVIALGPTRCARSADVTLRSSCTTRCAPVSAGIPPLASDSLAHMQATVRDIRPRYP